jgi:Flp pilus assembly protein TadG
MTGRPAVGPARRARPRGEDGSVSLLLVVMVFGLLIAVGLVVDGGQKLRSSQRASDAAGEAARAAVLSIEPGTTIRGQRPRVDQAAARRAAEDYLQRAGVAGSVTVGDGRVQVRTTSSFTPSFLSIIGLGSQTVTGQASARLVRGVEQEQPE